MTLDSLLFLYLFLPCSILLYMLTPARGRSLLLLGLSVIFLSLTDLTFLFQAIGLVLADWLLAGWTERTRTRPRLRRAILLFGVAKSVAAVIYLGLSAPAASLALPIGLNIVALTSTSYLLDCYYGWAHWERSPLHLLVLCLFFPRLSAGPQVSYARLSPLLREPRIHSGRIGDGASLLLYGLTKKLVLGDTLMVLLTTLHEIPPLRVTTLSVWTLVVTLALALYFILSGYCDIARGLAQIFGLDLPDNFSAPFLSKGINEFLARFNGTVNRSLRRYLHAPMGLEQSGPIPSLCIALLLAVPMGLWFGIRINLVLWSLFLTIFALIERYVFQRWVPFIAPFFRWGACMAVVLVSFAFFAGSNVEESFLYIHMMFGGGVRGANNDILYILASNHWVLIVAVLCASSLPVWLSGQLRKQLPRCSAILQIFVNAALFGLVTTFML